MAGKTQSTRTARRRPARVKGKSTRKWSAGVMQRSDALDLESGVFKKRRRVPGRLRSR
jgi:hypothetical protein